MMSEKSKTWWSMVVVLLLGVVIGGVGAELAGPGGKVVEVEVCPECPNPPEVVIPACPEAPDCVLVETPCPTIPVCPPCTCAKDTEYGCLHGMRPGGKNTEPPAEPEWNRPHGTLKYYGSFK